GYIGKQLFEFLFMNGIQLVTKVKSNMRNSLMSVADKIMLRKRALVESVNDELKNIAQIEHSRHRSFTNFITNALSAIAAYCFFPKKPSISLDFVFDNQLTLF
ncbi:transposase, partial [uncultured Duncaniella sp.]